MRSFYLFLRIEGIPRALVLAQPSLLGTFLTLLLVSLAQLLSMLIVSFIEDFKQLAFKIFDFNKQGITAC